MKKIIFFTLLLGGFLSTQSYAVTDTTVVQNVNVDLVYKDFKTLIQTVDLRADSLISRTARVVSNTADNIWKILVKQQRVNAWYIIFAWILTLMSMYKSTRNFHKYYMLEKEQNNESYAPYLIINVIWLIAACLMFYFTSTHMQQAFTGLFNPEYGAMQELYQLGTQMIK